MLMEKPEVRHACLFEMLRQKNLSQKTSSQVGIEPTYIDPDTEAELLKTLSGTAWSMPRPQPLPEDLRAALTAKPRRHHEFFRAVRP